MSNNARHIVSSVRWDTLFDRPDKAVELQQRVGDWSNRKMRREMQAVFDAICPPGQVWCINSLELDLGSIDYFDLEFELGVKLRRQLREKLTGLIISQGANNDNAIDIKDTAGAMLGALASYLHQGIMPWNQAPGRNTVNNMVAELLKNEETSLIAMLREEGAAHADVRKRLAWQLNEPNISGIIKGLEPASYNQITSFSSQLQLVQEKEKLVKAGQKDFNRSVWEWVLDYLLVKQGSAFNKVSLMESTIRQMANHYNLAYKDLLGMITAAVEKIGKTVVIKADFLVTLGTLTSGQRAKEELTAKPEGRGAGKNEYGGLLPVLQALSQSAGLVCINAKLLAAAVFFSKAYPNQAATGKAFLLYCLGYLAEENGLTKLQVLERLLSAPVPQRVKGLQAQDGYAALAAAWAAEAEKGNAGTVEYTAWLTQLCGQLDNGIADKAGFTRLLRLFKQCARQGPSGLLDALVNYPEKQALQKLLPYILEGDITNLLLARAKIKDIQFIIASLAENSGAAEDAIKKIILQAFVTHRGLDDAGLKELAKRVVLEHSPAKSGTASSFEDIDKYFQHKDYQFIISGELQLNYSNWCIDLRREQAKDSNLIIEYMLPGGGRLLDSLVKTYTALLKPRLPGTAETVIAGQLTELFWQCIVHYKEYQGDAGVFQRLFRAAVLLHFAQATRVLSSTRPANDIQERTIYAFKNGGSLSHKDIFLLIEQYITEGKNLIIHAGIKYNVRTLLNMALELSPTRLGDIINRADGMAKRAEALLLLLPFSRFLTAVTGGGYGLRAEVAEAVHGLYWITKRIVPGKTNQNLLGLYRRIMLRSLKPGVNVQEDVQKLAGLTIEWLQEEKRCSAGHVIYQFKKHSLLITPYLQQRLEAYHAGFSIITQARPVEKLALCAGKGLLEELVISLLRNGEMPSWFQMNGLFSTAQLLKDVIQFYPATFIRVIKREVLTVSQQSWLLQSGGFTVLKTGIAKMLPAQQSQLNMLQKLHNALGHVSINGISSRILQDILTRKLLKAWETGRWNTLSPSNIWNELIWGAGIKHGYPKETLIRGLLKARHSFPASLQPALDKLAKNLQAEAKTKAAAQPKIKTMANQTGIQVHNAGMVLLNSYFTLLLRRLDVLNGDAFKDAEAQVTAVHYLQYLATGISYTEEPLLPLNKLLCGLPLNCPVTAGIDIPVGQAAMIDGLIKAVISHWPAIGDCSVEGFRGNWLVRNGMLGEQEDKWVLTVEKRAYDVLISRSPFSFSTIKFSWMPKPLQVNWA